ncbi:hypothetical protein V8E53_011135 [Lactarius tabidus]
MRPKEVLARSASFLALETSASALLPPVPPATGNDDVQLSDVRVLDNTVITSFCEQHRGARATRRVMLLDHLPVGPVFTIGHDRVGHGPDNAMRKTGHVTKLACATLSFKAHERVAQNTISIRHAAGLTRHCT